MLQTVLLIAHITAGMISLLVAFVATGTKLFNMRHLWHVRSGKIFYYSMMFVAVSAVPLSAYSESLFLFLIAIFAGYLTLAGRRYAKNHTGAARTIDRVSVLVAALVGMTMAIYGVVLILSDDLQGITLAVFGGILIGYSIGETIVLSKETLANNIRIATHLTFMMGAAIASLTAFIVTNFTFEPEFVLWIGPSVVVTPLIIYANTKQLKSSR